jgi:hypothetical protein
MDYWNDKEMEWWNIGKDEDSGKIGIGIHWNYRFGPYVFYPVFHSSTIPLPRLLNSSIPIFQHSNGIFTPCA